MPIMHRPTRSRALAPASRRAPRAHPKNGAPPERRARRRRPQRWRPSRPQPAAVLIAVLILIALSMLVLLGPRAVAAIEAELVAAHTDLTIDQVLGCTTTPEAMLSAHEDDSYYLGTSFGNTGPDGQGGSINSWDSRYPNGRPGPKGSYMNCAGFVSAVITDCGGDVTPIATFVNPTTGYDRGNDTNASRWQAWTAHNAIECYEFATKEEMLASGVLERGDIIYIHPTNFTTGDAHMGFFWGSTSSEDLFWHSSDSGDGVIAGSAPGNMISRITPKSEAAYYRVIKTQHAVDVQFQKVSSSDAVDTSGSFYSLAGATYEIYQGTHPNGTLVDTIVTDEDGRAALELKPNESYYAIETVPPQGFALNPDPITFTTSSGGSTVKLPDVPGSVRLIVTKRDSTGVAQPGASLEGAVYRVTDANGVDHTGQTDEHGVVTFTDIPLGTITIVETKAPEGYRLDPTVYTYTVSSEDLPADGIIELAPHDGFTEHPIAFDIDIVKYLDTGNEGSGLQTPGAGIRFDIISGTTGEVVGSIETDEAGRASSAGSWFGAGEAAEDISGALPYDAGGYTVREDPSTTPAGYQSADEWHITPDQMVDGATLHYIVDNDYVASRIQVVKVDATTNQTVPAAGFTFQLLDSNREPITQEAWYPNPVETSQFTTDESGMVTFPQALRPSTYYVREIAVGTPPYLLNEEDIRVEIEDDPNLAPITIVRLTDEQAYGQATIRKTCASEESRDDATQHIHDAGCTGALADAEFDVVAREDVIAPDGTVQAVAGEIVDHVTTDENGEATTKPLSLGSGTATYAFIETKAPVGHVLDETPHEFTLTYLDEETPLVTAAIEASNHPTQTTVDKTVLGYGDALSEAVFTLWRADDEIPVVADAGAAAIVVDAGCDDTVSVQPAIDHAVLSCSIPDGYRVILTASDGTTHTAEDGMTISPGTYLLAAYDEQGSEIPGGGEVSIEESRRVAITVNDSFFFGPTVSLSDDGYIEDPITLPYVEEYGAHMATDLEPGSYLISSDDATQSVDLVAGTTAIMSETLETLPALLVDDAEVSTLVTNDEGTLSLRHLTAGSYRLWESQAPDGFLVDGTVHHFTVDHDGLTEGYATYEISIEDDFTKVDVSKRDITDETEIAGAQLAILDAEGNTVESWTSTTSAHRVEALKPGTYTLVELKTPHDFDEASAVTFTVEATGAVQRVALYDEPIAVSGEIDKRQEIANPTHSNTNADALIEDGGTNRAEVNGETDGSYDYTIDVRSTATTWVDEFTVTDELDAVTDGLAYLVGVTTPQGSDDYDGLLNVWYQTDQTASDYQDSAHANATRSDGHINPWLDDELTAERLGDDGRAVDYTGWHLWATNVSTSKAQTLSVADLDLAPDEHVIAVRFEFGRVEAGFTTRADEWERDDLKDEHDDLADVSDAHEDDGSMTEDGSEDQATTSYAPAIVHMRVTDHYQAGTTLENSARVELYRNGGSLHEHEQLEDADLDRVVQAPISTALDDELELHLATETLDQTGVPSYIPALAITTTLCAGVGVLAHHLRRAGSDTSCRRR